MPTRIRGDNGYFCPGVNGASSYVGRLDFFALGFLLDGGSKSITSSPDSGEFTSSGREKILGGTGRGAGELGLGKELWPGEEFESGSGAP